MYRPIIRLNEPMNYLAEMPFFQQHGLLVASASGAVFCAWTVWSILSILLIRSTSVEAHPFELQRRNALRQGCRLYRWFEPLVEEIEQPIKMRKQEKLDRLQRSLAQVDETLPWHGSDYLATKWVEGGLVAIGIGLLASLVQPWNVALIAAVATTVGYGPLAEYLLHKQATERAELIKKRLPYAIDLVALMMHAGGGFQECLATFVEESRGHPLANQFQWVINEIKLGRPRHEALEAMAMRLDDDDISELVFAINKGEELGTPISAILKDQAEQLRLKRSQWGEKAAAEAGVKVIFPGMLIVVACLLAVLAPFALPIVKSLWL